MKENKFMKWGAIGFLVNAGIYLLTELVAAIGTGFPLGYVYKSQFISALGVYNGTKVEGVPLNFSPLAVVMNIGFIVTAILFVISYIMLVFPKVKKTHKTVAYVLLAVAVMFGIGSLLVGIFQGGVPGEDSFHGIGARMSFLAGNVTVLCTGIFLGENKKAYKCMSIFLALVGFIAVYFLQVAMKENQQSVMAIYERLTVYPITAWQIITGITFLRNKTN